MKKIKDLISILCLYLLILCFIILFIAYTILLIYFIYSIIQAYLTEYFKICENPQIFKNLNYFKKLYEYHPKLSFIVLTIYNTIITNLCYFLLMIYITVGYEIISHKLLQPKIISFAVEMDKNNVQKFFLYLKKRRDENNSYVF